VSSYQVKISEGCFVWAAPTALRGGPYLIEIGAEFEPGTCKSTRRGAHMEDIYFKYLETGLYLHQVIHSLRDRLTVETPYNLRWRSQH
jgi:hypothetical protein